MSDCPVGILINLSSSTPELKAKNNNEGIKTEDNDGENTNNIESLTDSDKKELKVCNLDVHMAHLEEYEEVILPSSDCPVGILVDFSTSTPEPIQSTVSAVHSRAEKNNNSKENDCPVGILVDFSTSTPEPIQSTVSTVHSRAEENNNSKENVSKGSPRTFVSNANVKNASDQEMFDPKTIKDFSPINAENFDFSDFLANCFLDFSGPVELVSGVHASDDVDSVEAHVGMLSQSSLKVEPDKFSCIAEKEMEEPSPTKLLGQESSFVNVPNLNLIGVEKDGDLAEKKVLTRAITNKDQFRNEDLNENDQLTSSKESVQSNTDEQKGYSRLRRKGTFTVKDTEVAEALKQRVQLSDKNGNSETSKAQASSPAKRFCPKKKSSGLDLKPGYKMQKTTDKVKELKPGHNGKSRPVKPTRKSLLGSSAGSISKSRSVLDSSRPDGTTEDSSMDLESHDISITASHISTSSAMSTKSSRVAVTRLSKPMKTNVVAKFGRATDGISKEQLRPGRKSFGGNTRESIKVMHLPTTNRRHSLQTQFSQVKKNQSEGIIERKQSKTDKAEVKRTESSAGASTPIKAKRSVKPKKLALPTKMPQFSNPKRVW